MNNKFTKLIQDCFSRLISFKVLSYVIFFFSLIPVYIILCVKLNCKLTPYLGYSNNSEAINEVLLNLSYSYIAATIFFILLTYLPHKIRTKHTKDYIITNVKLINKNIDLILLMLDGNDPNAKFKVTQTKINELVDKNYSREWEQPEKKITQSAKHSFIAKTASSITLTISEILYYRDYIDENLYKQLLEIKGDITLHYLTAEFFPAMCNQREDAKEAFKFFLYNLTKKIRELQKVDLRCGLLEFE